MIPIADFNSNVVNEEWLQKYKLSTAITFFYEYQKNQFRYE